VARKMSTFDKIAQGAVIVGVTPVTAADIVFGKNYNNSRHVCLDCGETVDYNNTFCDSCGSRI